MNREHIEACAASLNFLGRLFQKAPEDDLLIQIKDAGIFHNWPLFPPSSDPVGQNREQPARALEDLRDYFTAYGPGRHGQLEEEYTTLFEIPERSIHMWETAWTTRERLLFEEPMFDVRARYADYGLEAPNRGYEPDDSVGLELSFLGGVLGYVARAMADNDRDGTARHVRAGAEFLTLHILPWVPGFLDRVREHESSVFYAAISELTGSALACATHVLRELMGHEPFDALTPGAGIARPRAAREQGSTV